jgi:hypothetical protein
VSTPTIIAPGVLWPAAELVPVFEALRWLAQAPPQHQPRQQDCPWCALTAYAARCFAQANAWTVRSASFSLPMLRSGRTQRRGPDDYGLPDPARFDHPQFFVAPDRPDRRLRPVALVVHNTDPRAIPTAPGFRVDPLPDSWVWPRVLRAWVVRPQPEQDA